MSLDTKEKESATVDGAVSYEAVECERCGYDTPVEEAMIVYIPTNTKKKHRTHSNNYMKVEYASDGGQRAFCPECSESVFGERPTANYQHRLDEWIQGREWRFLLIALVHMGGLVLALIGLIALFTVTPA